MCCVVYASDEDFAFTGGNFDSVIFFRCHLTMDTSSIRQCIYYLRKDRSEQVRIYDGPSWNPREETHLL